MKILIADGLAKEGLERITNAGYEAIEKKLSQKELISEIGKYDALIVRSATKVTKDVIDATENTDFKVIGRAGVGYDNIDVKAATEKGIVVKNAPHGNTNAAAELTFGLILSIARDIPQSYHTLKSNVWKKKEYKGSELAGKTLGMIGCGRIGKRVASIAKGFDMNILGYDPYCQDFINLVSLDKLLEKSDYITLHIPKLEKPLIGKKELAKMKKTAYLINTSRGGNVDEVALYEALKNSEIAGAALDVYAKEGKEGEEFKNKLLSLENFIGTTHLGASTEEAQKKTAIEIADVVVSYLKNGDWENAVNIEKETEYKPKEKETYNLFVHHDDKPGMFSRMSGVFEKYNMNITDMPSRRIGEKAKTIFKAQKIFPEELIKEIKSLDGVYSANTSIP